MPEKVVFNPKKEPELIFDKETLLSQEKLQIQQPRPSIFQVYQYSSAIDYFLTSLALVLTVVFSMILVQFIVQIGEVIELVQTKRFFILVFPDELRDIGYEFLKYGYTVLFLGWIAVFISLTVGKNISLRWRDAYFRAFVHRPQSWHRENPDYAEKIHEECHLIETASGEKLLLITAAIVFYAACWEHSFSTHKGLSLIALAMVPFQLIAAFLLPIISTKNVDEKHKELEPLVSSRLYSLKTSKQHVGGNSEFNEKVDSLSTRTVLLETLHMFGWALNFVVLYSFSAALFYLISQIMLKEPDWWFGDYMVMPKEAVMIFIATAISAFFISWVVPSCKDVYRAMKTALSIDQFIKDTEFGRPEEIVEFEEQAENKKESSGFSVVFEVACMEAKYWYWLALIVVSAGVSGVTFPIFGYFFADNVATLLFLFGPFDIDSIKEDMIDRIVETVVILVALTLLGVSLGGASAAMAKEARKKIMESLSCTSAETLKQRKYDDSKINKVIVEDCQNFGYFIGAVLAILALVVSSFCGAYYYIHIKDDESDLMDVVLSVSPFIMLASVVAEYLIENHISTKPCIDVEAENMEKVKANHGGNHYYKKYMRSADESETWALLYNNVRGFLFCTRYFVMFLFWAVIIYFTADEYEKGKIEIADIFVALFCVTFCFWCFLVVGAIMPNIEKCVESSKRVMDLIRKPNFPNSVPQSTN